MSDDKVSKAETIARSVEKISDGKGLAAIGIGLGWGIAAVAAALAFVSITMVPASSKWDGHLFPQQKCFEIKELSGKILEINTCTGEVEEITPQMHVQNGK